MTGTSRRVRRGDVVSPRALATVGGDDVRVPDAQRVVHLQFRRYAGCPVCSVHLRSFARRQADIEVAGVREIVVFHSGRDALREHQHALPFDLVPDPGRDLYRQFGVERSWFALVHPKVWLAALRGGWPVRGFRSGPGGHLGVPADVLIGPDGQVLASHYGRHADDQWSVDDLLGHVGELASG